MIICDYCDHYATKGFCDKCPYGELLESDLRGNLWAYVTSNKVSWTKEEAENELKDLEVGNGTDIRTN